MTAVYFNGERIAIPGAYASVDASAMGSQQGGTSKVIAILGQSKGGEPGAIQLFNNPVAARKVLKDGDLLKACEKAWNPVSDTKEGLSLDGAYTIAAIRTNSGTQSAFAYTVAGVDTKIIEIKSRDYGAHVNYQLKLYAHPNDVGTSSLSTAKQMYLDGKSGLYDFVAYDQPGNAFERFDGLGQLFAIKYTGSNAEAMVTVRPNSDTGFKELVAASGDSGDVAAKLSNPEQCDFVISLNPAIYSSIRSVINEVNSHAGYAATCPYPFNGNLKVTDIDPTGDTSSNCSGEQTAVVTALIADIADTLNRNSDLVKVTEWNNGVISSGTYKNVPEIGSSSTYAAMTGGTDGAASTDWTDYLDAIGGIDVQYIVPLTADAGIQGSVRQHVLDMSGSMGRERRAIMGGAIDESIAVATRRAQTLSSDRVQVVYGGFYDYKDNVETLYPPYILAAAVAGRAAGLEDGESATHDTFRMLRPEKVLSASEIEQCLSAGLLAFEQVLSNTSATASFVRLVWDGTTDTAATDTLHTERAVGALADSINREMRLALDKMLTGKRTALADATSAKNRVISILFNRQRQGHILAYNSVNVTKNGTTTTVEYNVAPAEPNNFTLITAHYYSEPIAV